MAGISKAERERRAAEAAAAAVTANDPRPASVGLVRMVRSPQDFLAPHQADVHPDEVRNYSAGGWRVA